MHEQPRPLHVGEELVAEAGAPARALDQAGDVGDHELALVALERAEHRLDRRERVGGHLRPRSRQPGEQGRLARVRQSHEPDVREQPPPQLEPALLAGQTALGEARRLARRAGEALVAPSARAAPGDRRPLARGRQVVAVAPLRVLDDRPRRDRDLERGRARAVPLAALAVAATGRLEVRAPPERLEIAQRRVADEHDVRPTPPVAAVRPALRDVRLTAKRQGTVASGARLYEDLRAVVEHGPRLAPEPRR